MYNVPLFQFHKVRLKDGHKLHWYLGSFVSIPQGTIKS